MAQQKADLQRLQGAAGEITQEACMRNVTADLQAEADAEHAEQMAAWKAQQKTAQFQEGEDEDEDFDDDVTLRELESKRLQALKERFNKEKAYHAQGHGELREIVEEEFLKEVCGSEHVAVHFYHDEFIRCKLMDKHLRMVAHDHVECKFLKINADKAPFFVEKIGVQVLPTVVVFKDGKIVDLLMGFEDIGGSDDFKTPALERWLSMQGCIKLKKHSAAAHANGDCCASDEDSASDGELSENYDY